MMMEILFWNDELCIQCTSVLLFCILDKLLQRRVLWDISTKKTVFYEMERAC